ncbi:DUF4437 domain-containing protein [Aeromicrobium sp. UC242_57]|uniref:DUF4437 domain-containing protein n=1 Tax=Aeromicrobium sp. UC242_57 TaxID=3374624 RepID=UPI0037A7A534
MRPHVETIAEHDLIWHIAEFEHATGTARQRNLCYDEEDGSASLKVHFTTDWSRPAGVHAAETEWYVLEGQVRIGDTVLGPEGYWHASAGVLTPPLEVAEGSVVLVFREFGDWAFTPADADSPIVRPDQELIVLQTSDMPWIDVEDGSPMRFDIGGTPRPRPLHQAAAP